MPLLLEEMEPAPQIELETSPYDRWVTPSGAISALFFKVSKGFLVRFPGQADFIIHEDMKSVELKPSPGSPRGVGQNLFQNSIAPLVGNFVGGLNLHASVISLEKSAIAFAGISGRGKTTLAAAFAACGHAFLSEDILELRKTDGRISAQPTRPVLRLYEDSARAVMAIDGSDGDAGSGQKLALPSSNLHPYRSEALPLEAIYILAEPDSKSVSVHSLHPAEALAAICKHTFILDVEDRERLRAHFERLAKLAESIPIYELSYPRDYAKLPEVIDHIIKLSSEGKALAD